MTVPVSAASHDGQLQCGATNRAGRPCGQRAGWGTNHVGEGRRKLHGGKVPGVERAAEARRARGVAQRLALDLEVNESPTEVLLGELRRARSLALLFEDQLSRGEATVSVRTDFGPTMSVEAQLWQAERDRAVRISALCIRHNLEERRIRLAEDAGRELANFVRAIGTRLGVRDHPDFITVVTEEIGRMKVLEVPAGANGRAAV